MPKHVRLMCDYNGWPLWDEEGGTGPEHWPMISPTLRHALAAWEDYWSSHFHHQRGWEPGTQASYVAEGHRLAEAVQKELGDDYEVDFVP